MLCDWLVVGQVIATNPATIDCLREVQPAIPKVWSWLRIQLIDATH
jgi:hypothetical protein